MPEVRALFTAPGRRLTDQDLVDMQAQQVNTGRGRGGRGGGNNDPTFPVRRAQFFAREGVAAMIEPGSGRNDHGAILVTNAPRQYRDAKEPLTHSAARSSPASTTTASCACSRRNMPVTIELNVQNRFVDDTVDSFNIVAEIPGTDRSDEIVMLGAHFDSWHAGTGATDNAAGVAATMEAVRILRASGVRMRRTVRLALWTGEEQGLLGSREYVKQQFGDPDTMQLKPGHSRLSGYFNMDNGTGAIRGVYLQGNEAVRPVFAAWMEPLRNLGMTTLTIRNTGADRSRGIRRGRAARLPVHPGSRRVRDAFAPHEHGPVRPDPGGGPDEELGHHRVVRVPRGEPGHAAAAQGAPAGTKSTP